MNTYKTLTLLFFTLFIFACKHGNHKHGEGHGHSHGETAHQEHKHSEGDGRQHYFSNYGYSD